MKKKGFTLVELLVVIAIIALLMGILMPALARVRQIAYRLYCGTNLSGLGKAMLIYCQDYDDEFPRAGYNTGRWAQAIADWTGVSSPYGTGTGDASIASCFYLLVKYTEVTPKSFICKGDTGVQEFKAVDMAPGGRELTDLYNFGINGIQYCSYSYHTPFINTATPPIGYGLSTQSDPGMAVAADPNPWLKSCEAPARTTWGAFVVTGNREQIKNGNAVTHQFDGQNVLFVDGHTSFEKESFCGVDEDNIYTQWTSTVPASAERRKGLQLSIATGVDQNRIPQSKTDSLLLTDNGLTVVR
ncbi:MAG: type II secretion system protein [Sedimentisphaerales bacterium]|nr:type II secretion system protein [Sedimentisphaerales bacterium]